MQSAVGFMGSSESKQTGGLSFLERTVIIGRVAQLVSRATHCTCRSSPCRFSKRGIKDRRVISDHLSFHDSTVMTMTFNITLRISRANLFWNSVYCGITPLIPHHLQHLASVPSAGTGDAQRPT